MSDKYHDFIDKIHKKIGIDLSLYKETQMRRRITTLRNKRGYTSYDDYYNHLISDNELLDEFLDRLTINVSEFFRNLKRWEVLRKSIFPLLLEKNKHLSIWSAACSTGEEPYSIAILLKEYFPSVQVTILATDLDDNVLAKAEEGIYHEQSLKEIPKSFISTYFSQTNEGYKIKEKLKKDITFKKHNLLSDSYPKNIDLIICRNVLIYFTDEAKEKIYRSFSQTLKKDGVLFVGSTEQIFNPPKYDLNLVDTFFYQKN